MVKALNQDDKQNHLNKRQKTNRLLGSVQSKHPKVYGAINQLSRIGITIGNKIDSDLNLRLNQRHISSKYNLDCADHICVRRFSPTPYTHHGLYLGFGLVIHYDFSRVSIVTLEQFAKGQPICLVNSGVDYPKEVVMVRALSRLGEKNYHLITNNCEHLVRWYRNGPEINL